MKPPLIVEMVIDILKIIINVLLYFLTCKFLKDHPKLRMLGIFFIFLIFIAYNQYRMGKAGQELGKKFAPPPTTVATIIVAPTKWRDSLSLVGSLNSEKGAIISAEESGKISKINVANGAKVKKGEVLIELDSVAEYASLNAGKIKRDAAQASFKRSEALVKIGSISREEFESAKTSYRAIVAEVEQLQTRINRRNIKSPLTGTAGIRRVNVGDYVTPGTQIVPVYDNSALNLDFNIPQKNIKDFAIGTPVKFTSDLSDKIYVANVNASDPQVDSITRTIKIQAKFKNGSGELKPGIFAKLEFPVGRDIEVFAIPATAVAKAPYGDSVYVVAKINAMHPILQIQKEYIGVEQRFVKILAAKGDQVGVISGLKSGEKIVTNGVFKLMPNLEVIEDNSIQPDNSTKPNPENS